MATKIVIGTKSTAISIKTKNNTITINNIMASFGKILTPGYGDYLILKNVAYNLSKKNYIVNNKNIPIVNPVSEALATSLITGIHLGAIFLKYGFEINTLLYIIK